MANCTKMWAKKLLKLYIITNTGRHASQRPVNYTILLEICQEKFFRYFAQKNAPIKWGQDKPGKCGRHLQGQKPQRKSGHFCGSG